MTDVESKPTTWTWLWLAWGLAFLAIELPAALNKLAGDTLSEHGWDWFSWRARKAWWLARRVVFVAFWLGIGAHFIFQAPAWWSVIVPIVPFLGVVVYAVAFERLENKR